MFETVFDRASESLLGVIHGALEDCLQLKNRWVCTENLLLSLTKEQDNLAAHALNTMNITFSNAQKEVEKLRQANETEPLYSERSDVCDLGPQRPRLSVLYRHDENIETVAFSLQAVQALKRADDYSLYFGAEEIEPEHLLLGILDIQDASVNKVLEELAANLTFLRRQIMAIVAHERFKQPHVPTLRSAVIDGLRELITRYQATVNSLTNLAARAGGMSLLVPGRSQLVHMVCMAHLGEMLSTQVSFQRYLLEESIRSLGQRIGGLDKELSASIVSSGAQTTRSELRGCIEYVWCNEYRLRTQLLDEADYDLIGSVVEDLWWAQSEEIALQDLFAEALDDHRRGQVLSLQKRRMEIAQRLIKLRARLEDTIRQCFVKYSASA